MLDLTDTGAQNKNHDQHQPQDLEPPGPDDAKLEKPLLLIAQTIYLMLISIPVIIYSVIEWCFAKAEPKSLKGKVALVTGSGRGLGRGLAMKFAQLGCKVACVDINEAINRQTVLEINEKYGAGTAAAYTCNVALPEQVAHLRKRILLDFGAPVDLLVNNAALIAGTPSASVTSFDFDDIYLHGIVTVNLSSHFFMIREFLPDMIDRNQGHIVAVSSLAGFTGIAKASMYVATKHGVVGLMESLHYELEAIPNNRIKTSVICPYFVNTSALYQKSWHLRVPELSVDRVVNEAVAGIRTNTRIIASPAHMYYMANISKLLPDRLNRAIRNIYYVKLQAPPMEFQKKLPIYRLLMKSFTKLNLKFDLDE